MHYKNGMSSVSSTTNGYVQHRILQDTVYGTHPIPGNYHLHMYFLFQANPASGEKYGHFNFLKFPHEDTTTTVDQKRTSQKLISVKKPTVRHSTPENVKAFWTKWSGCIATIPSSNAPLPPPCDPPDDTPQQTSGDQPTDSGEAMEGVLLAKCVAETHEKENQAEQTDDSKTGLENVDTAAHTALPEAPTATTVLIEHASSPSTEEAPACEEAPMHKHDSPQQANTCKTINPEALAATAEPHAMQPPCEHQPEAPTATTGLMEHASNPSTEEAPACEETAMHKHDSPQQANTCKTINPEALAATAEPHAMQPPCEHQPEAPTATTGLMEHASNPSTEEAPACEETAMHKHDSPQQANTCKTINPEALAATAEPHAMQPPCEHQPEAPTATTGLIEHASSPSTEEAPACEEAPMHKHDSPQQANTCKTINPEALAATAEPRAMQPPCEHQPEAPTATTGLMEHASNPSTEEAPACEETTMHKHDSPQQANTCKNFNSEALAATAEPHAMQPPSEHQPEAPTATTGLMAHASNPSTEATTENDTNYERAEAFVRRLQAFQQHRVGRIDDSFESEEETIPSDDETPEPQGKDSQSVDDDQESMYQVWVVRLSGFEISMLFDGKTSAEMIMSWSAKKLLGTIYLMGSKPGCVVGTAVVKQQGPIKNFADLRATQWFTEASRDRRETWKNRMLKEEKPLYLWKLEEIKKLESPKRVPIYGKASCRSFAVSFGQLTSLYERALPGLDLCETTDYFRNLLSQTDLQKLHQTMKCLDGRVIRVGTTCSGTDIGVSTLKLTILSLAKHFGVTRRMFFFSKFSL